jgi:KinB signaling pathway activation protein
LNLRKWLYLFWTTLLIGAAASFITGLYMQITDPQLQLFDLPVILFNIGIGLMYSVFSQMGFFAYLTVNYIAKGIITRKFIWTTLQWILIIIVFFDLIYLRYTNFAVNEGIAEYFILPVLLFVFSLSAALWKSNLTNSSAFTPTLFFLFVVTALELVPAIRINKPDTILLMLVPLFCCNTWQILKLHTLLNSPKN